MVHLYFGRPAKYSLAENGYLTTQLAESQAVIYGSMDGGITEAA
jgi:hypothetical protein